MSASVLVQGILTSLVSGMSYGLIVGLLAAGLSLIYGNMNCINTSHGAFCLLGGYLAYSIYSLSGFPLAVDIAISVILSFIIGVSTIYVLIPKSMWVTEDPQDQSSSMILLLAFATILQQVLFLVYGGSSIAVPGIVPGAVAVFGGIYLPSQTLVAATMSLITYALLYLLLYYTKIGNAIRASAQNKELAAMRGISVNNIVLATFGLGISLAALSGALLSSIYSVTPDSGFDFLIIAFVIVTLGGIGSTFGSLLGGILYGIAYSEMQYYFPSFSFPVILFLIYVTLVLKPEGIFGKTIERA